MSFREERDRDTSSTPLDLRPRPFSPNGHGLTPPIIEVTSPESQPSVSERARRFEVRGQGRTSPMRYLSASEKVRTFLHPEKVTREVREESPRSFTKSEVMSNYSTGKI